MLGVSEAFFQYTCNGRLSPSVQLHKDATKRIQMRRGPFCEQHASIFPPFSHFFLFDRNEEPSTMDPEDVNPTALHPDFSQG